jgi:hypothetical protein
MPAKIINHHRKHHLAYTHACQYAQGFAIVRSCALHAHGHYKLEAQLIYDSGFDIEQTFLNKQAVYALRTYLHDLPHCCYQTRSISKPVTRATRDYECAGRRIFSINVSGIYKANGRMRCA